MRWIPSLVDRQAILQRIIPIVLVLISDIGYVLVNETVYSLRLHGMPLGQIIFLSSTVILTPCLAFTAVMSPGNLSTQSLFGPKSLQVWYRAISCIASFLLLFASTRYISLSEGLSIIHFRPIPIAVLCWVYLKERYSGFQCILSLMSLIGAWSILEPEFTFPPLPEVEGKEWEGSYRLIGFGMVILAMTASCVDYTCIRKMERTADPSLLILTASACGAVTGLLWMIIERTPFHSYTRQQVNVLSLLSVCSWVGQYTLILALRRESAAKIASLGHLQVVGSVIFHRWLIARLPPFGLVCRMTFMVISALATAALGTLPMEDADEERQESMQLLAVANQGHQESST